MSDIIHLLPDNIANQIAAGEVIQRPASVVKELMENAVDADAHTIQVVVKDAGRTLIQVIDDGKGMSESDAVLAFERHATSKISTVDDLYALHTMGFRGEALASIVAVSQVELRTKPHGAEIGTSLSFTGSKMEGCTPDACAEGSNFQVKNIFFNVPARRKFLKSNEVELRNIITEFERVALVHPDLNLTLIHNGAQILNLPQSVQRQRILNVFGKSLNDKLLNINAQSSLATISGYVTTPDAARRRGAFQYFFVNGRFMKHPMFHKAVMEAFEGLIPEGDCPGYFIYFQLDPSEIDVNIHPTKTEIKFENELPIRQILVACIREALAKQSAVPTIDFQDSETNASLKSIPVYNSSSRNVTNSLPPIQVDPTYSPFANTKKESKTKGFDWEKLYESFTAEKNELRKPEMQEEQPHKESLTFDDDTEFVSAKALSIQNYQYKGKYIVTALGSGLAFIDQHRAHFRILYDRFLAMVSKREGVVEQELFPEVIEFTSSEVITLRSILSDLQGAGFALEDLGDDKWSINGLPNGLGRVNAVSLLKDIVAQTIETELNATRKIAESIAFSMASSAAIPVGKKLMSEEIDQLIADLFSCANPNLTPDGQTIITLISDKKNNKRFK